MPTEPLEAWFDPDILDKILVNLLSNAFKFTPDGGRVRLVLEFAGDAAPRRVPQPADDGSDPGKAAAPNGATTGR